MDVNLVVPISTMQTDNSGFITFVQTIEKQARTCAGLSSPPTQFADGSCSDQIGRTDLVASAGVNALATAGASGGERRFWSGRGRGRGGMSLGMSLFSLGLAQMTVVVSMTMGLLSFGM